MTDYFYDDVYFPKSEVISSMYYNRTLKRLYVAMVNSKHLYACYAVPAETWFDFVNSASKGNFYSCNIKEKFVSHHLDYWNTYFVYNGPTVETELQVVKSNVINVNFGNSGSGVVMDARRTTVTIEIDGITKTYKSELEDSKSIASELETMANMLDLVITIKKIEINYA